MFFNPIFIFLPTRLACFEEPSRWKPYVVLLCPKCNCPNSNLRFGGLRTGMFAVYGTAWLLASIVPRNPFPHTKRSSARPACERGRESPVDIRVRHARQLRRPPFNLMISSRSLVLSASPALSSLPPSHACPALPTSRPLPPSPLALSPPSFGSAQRFAFWPRLRELCSSINQWFLHI